MLSEHTDWRWTAVQTRNAQFDGVFYFGVETTRVFCRPSCSSRSPKRQNVRFFVTPVDAERAGFRACLRCKPTQEFFPGPAATLVAGAFEILQTETDEVPTIADLATRLNVSPGHLQKTFKAVLGLSPKEVTDIMRIENFKKNVKRSDVTTSLYDSGFGSSRSLYEKGRREAGHDTGRL